ncbi:MAG: glycosyltransferase family 4 protein [Variovorax sp.]
MRILIYSSVFYPSIGGIENLTLALAREFLKSGHQVKVITEQVQDPDAPLQGIEVVHSSRVAMQLKLFFWCDVLYMPNITLKGVWLFFFNPFKKWVISHNDFHLSNTPGRRSKLKNLVIRGTARNISVSRSVASALPVRSTVIYNCYNDATFRIYGDAPRDTDFLFVGRLVSQKGCEMLIEACARLRRDFRLSIVGDGAERERLIAKVGALGLAQRITFVGFMRDEGLAQVMSRHRVMIVPSIRAEGFGIVALEGLACGCRMIVSDAGGLPEAIGAFGSVFPTGDVGALAALLDDCLARPQVDPMTEAKMDFLRDHSAPRVARKYLDFFQA